MCIGSNWMLFRRRRSSYVRTRSNSSLSGNRRLRFRGAVAGMHSALCLMQLLHGNVRSHLTFRCWQSRHARMRCDGAAGRNGICSFLSGDNIFGMIQISLDYIPRARNEEDQRSEIMRCNVRVKMVRAKEHSEEASTSCYIACSLAYASLASHCRHRRSGENAVRDLLTPD